MQKNITLLLIIATLAVVGCQKKSQPEPLEKPVSAPGAGSNGALKTLEIPAGCGKKSTVTQTINGGGYTYVEVVDDKGQKIWLGLPNIKVAAGDKIEYRETPPMLNFNSKILNKKFDKILFVSGIRIEQK